MNAIQYRKLVRLHRDIQYATGLIQSLEVEGLDYKVDLRLKAAGLTEGFLDRTLGVLDNLAEVAYDAVVEGTEELESK